MKANVFWLCENDFKNRNDRLKQYCKLAGNYLAAAHKPCLDIVNKNDKQYKFFPVLYDNFSKYDNQVLLNELINTKNDKIKLSVKPKTDEKFMSVNYGCFKFLDFIRFQLASIDSLSESLNEEDFFDLKKEFSNHWTLLSKKLAYLYEFNKNLEVYEEPVDEILEFGHDAHDSMVKIKYPIQDEIHGTNQGYLTQKNGRVIKELYNKADILLLTDIFQKFINVS